MPGLYKDDNRTSTNKINTSIVDYTILITAPIDIEYQKNDMRRT